MGLVILQLAEAHTRPDLGPLSRICLCMDVRLQARCHVHSKGDPDPDPARHPGSVYVVPTRHLTRAVMESSADVCVVQEVRAALAQLPYNTNDVYLHTDASLMPRDRAVWASWNVVGSSKASSEAAVCVTYWANRLQVGCLCSVV